MFLGAQFSGVAVVGGVYLSALGLGEGAQLLEDASLVAVPESEASAYEAAVAVAEGTCNLCALVVALCLGEDGEGDAPLFAFGMLIGWSVCLLFFLAHEGLQLGEVDGVVLGAG